MRGFVVISTFSSLAIKIEGELDAAVGRQYFSKRFSN